jgi:filamentous hemagglutinin family protein
MRTTTKPSRALLALICLLAPLAGRAAPTIVRDNTLGTGPTGALVPAGSVNFNGASYGKIAIPESYGQRVGGNVFHSFKNFDIGAGQAAVFGITSAAGNIISRVTGGQASQIAGLLTVDAGATASRPNVYLINPAGVTFSAGAAIDVPAAFNVSTANVLTFPNGRFESDPAKASTLSSADPAAFGFSGANPALVWFKSGAKVQGAAGHGITVAAGDIAIDGADLITSNGDLRLAAAGDSAASVAVAGTLPEGLRGTLLMTGNANAYAFTADGRSSGDFLVSSGELYLGDRAMPGAVTVGTATVAGGKAGAVDLSASGLLYFDRGANAVSNTSGAGDTGAINVRAADVVVDGGDVLTGIHSYTWPGGTGKSGPVSVVASGSIEITRGGAIYSQSDGQDSAGNVSLQASKLYVDDGGLVHSSAHGTGGTGKVKLTGGDIIIGGGPDSAGLSTYVDSGAAGAAGAVEVNASGTLLVKEGGYIMASSGAAAAAGGISLNVDGKLTITDGALVATSGNAAFSGGTITVNAGELFIGGAKNSAGAGIQTGTKGAGGKAGDIIIRSPGAVSLVNGGTLFSSASGRSSGGTIDVAAKNILVTGAYSSIGSDGVNASGAAGAVKLLAQDQLVLSKEATITSFTSGAGDAGSVSLQAREILIDGQGLSAFVSTGTVAGSTGKAGTIDIAADKLVLRDAGWVGSDTQGAGDAGTVSIRAGSMLVENRWPGAGRAYGVKVDALPGSVGNAGIIDIALTGQLSLLGWSSIASDMGGTGNGGTIRIGANTIVLDGEAYGPASIGSATVPGTKGSAGAVSVQAAGLLLMPGDAYISTTTYGGGRGGDIRIRAAAIDMGGQGRDAAILSSAKPGSSGNAGDIDIAAVGRMTMGDGAAIQSGTLGAGKGGGLTIHAGSLRMESGPYIAEISSNASAGSGAAGNVAVTVDGALDLFNGAVITSDTRTAGNAGTIHIDAGSILIDGNGGQFATGISSLARDTSTGNAGTLAIRSRGDLTIRNAGTISTRTFSSGNAGAISVSAGSLNIETGNVKITGILSDTEKGSSGDAGSIEVHVGGALNLRDGGFISTGTAGAGAGGALGVDAGSLLLDHGEISASTDDVSGGQTGKVNVNVRGQLTLVNEGVIGIRNLANVANPGVIVSNGLLVNASSITVDHSLISSDSYGNIAAGPIEVSFRETLLIKDGGGIVTRAMRGDGGALTVRGGKLISLDSGGIMTSVLGESGNGGDIQVSADTLVMQTGFIQANTAAANAKGGEVDIDVRTLLSSGNNLLVGGSTDYVFARDVFGFNVIQAAAPTGVSGTVSLSSPALDIAGSLAALSTQQVDTGGLGRNPCQATAGSTLAVAGRGGMPPSARGLLAPAAVLGPVDAAVRNDQARLAQTGCHKG